MAMENPPFIDEFHISALVGGLEYEFYFSHHIGNVIIPTDELNPSQSIIFQRGRSTTNQVIYAYWQEKTYTLVI